MVGNLSFEDGMWHAIEWMLQNYSEGDIQYYIKSASITREKAIPLAKKSGMIPDVIQQLDELEVWRKL